MRVAGSLLLVICARCACACAYTAANHGGGRPRSAGVAAHGGAGQELARDSLLTGELPPGVFALLKNLFGEQQMLALADYVQASLMLNYNGRRVG